MVYKNGRMELYIHEFFPCTAAVAKKVFPLIRRFAKDEDKEKLKQFLLHIFLPLLLFLVK